MAKIAVAPLVGAWIEIYDKLSDGIIELVAPLVGAWIEIRRSSTTYELGESSLPSWERGLKSQTALAGIPTTCRSPRGSVD